MGFFKVAWGPGGCDGPGAGSGWSDSGVHPTEGFPSRAPCPLHSSPIVLGAGERAGNPTQRSQARVLAGSPGPSALGRGRGCLTWAARGSSAEKGTTWAAPLRGVCSSGCPSGTESSSCSPGDGGLAPSMDGRGGLSPLGSRRHTPHPRVQSPKLPPGSSLPTPVGGGRGGERETSGGGRGHGQGRAVFLVCSGRCLRSFPCSCRSRRDWLAGHCGRDGLAALCNGRKLGFGPQELSVSGI